MKGSLILTFCFLILLSQIRVASSENAIKIHVLKSNQSLILVKMEFPEPKMLDIDNYKQVLYPEEGTTRSVGKPELPAVTRFIAIPDNATCNFRVVHTESYTKNGIRIVPYNRGTDYEKPAFECDTEFYKKDTWYPERTLETGSPAIMRDARFIPITIFPVTYNPKKGEIKITKEIEIEISFSYANPENPKFRRRNTFSSAFVPLYRKFFVNYDNILTGEKGQRGSYLIIVPDALYNNVLSLADWKNRKGNQTVIKKISEVGSTNSQIKNFILSAYNTWPVPPDYVLLVGDVDVMPTFYDYDPHHNSNYATDLPYSQLEGSDIFPDVFIGRISADNTLELDVITAKILSYEKAPVSPTTWLGKFLCAAGRDFESQPETKVWVQKLVQSYGYTTDTLFARNGANATMITNAINNGRAYINYRGGGWGYGWREPYYDTNNILYNLSNGWKLPVMTSINCGAGKFNWSGGECFGEIWLRAGTPSNPKGGVAFIGASHWTYASRNNSLDVGIYRAIFNDSLIILGQAMNAGKLFMFSCYPEYDTTKIEYGVYHILGDPELNMWTGIPENLTVTHSAIIHCGNTGFDVSVRDNNNFPVRKALVCLVKGTEIYSYDYTDSQGNCHFLINPITSGTLNITVTALNFIPYEGSASVISNTTYVGYESHFIDDDNSGGSSGNNDGEVNPGETIEMPLVLKNFGTQSSYNVSAILHSINSLVTITDSVETFGDISAQDTALSNEDFDFVVPSSLRFGDPLGLSLNISDNDSTWYSYFQVPVFACNISYVGFIFYDGGNGIPEPGENAGFSVTLENTGNATAANLNAILRIQDPYISISDSLGSFGNIASGNNATNSSDRFHIYISQNAYKGYKANFTLYLSASGYYIDSLNFVITIGPVTNGSPTGPDEYGYYAYDNSDLEYTESPQYSWTEIDPNYGGSGTLLPLWEDRTVTIPLPFTFKYYGIDYDSISICANGWIAAGKTHLGTYANWPIPDTYGPPAMIAPFWDDLTDSLPVPYHIYYQYDISNHLFIVEWSRIYHTYADSIPHPADPETFENILYDPNYYSTITGDGEIICQYKTIINSLSCTVGIENKEQTIGLQYVYNGTYSSGASTIDDATAVKFTTDPPLYTGIEETKNPKSETRNPRLTIFPNPFTKETVIRYSSTVNSKSSRLTPNSLRIYDVSGRLVRSFSLFSPPSSLFSSVTWDGKDEKGKDVRSGVYFVRLKSMNVILLRKLIKLSNF